MDEKHGNSKAWHAGIGLLVVLGCSARQANSPATATVTTPHVKPAPVSAPAPEEGPASEPVVAVPVGPVDLDDRVFFVQSSSTHRDVDEHSFQPPLLFDDDLQTCWQEGNPSVRGEREFVTVYFEVPVDISQIRVATGCQRAPGADGDPFEMNPRPRQIIGVSNKGSRTVMDLEDSRGIQSHDVDLQGVRHLTLQIQAVYKGSEWTDGSISELSFTGQVSSEPVEGSWAPGLVRPDGGGVGTSPSTLMNCSASDPLPSDNDALRCIESIPLQIWRQPLNLSKLADELPKDCTLESLADAVGRSTTQHVRVGRLRSDEEMRIVHDFWPLIGVGSFWKQDFVTNGMLETDNLPGRSTGLTLLGTSADMETAWRIAYGCAGVQELVTTDISALPLQSTKGKRWVELTGLNGEECPECEGSFEWRIETHGERLQIYRIDRGAIDLHRYVGVAVLPNAIELWQGSL